MTRRPDFVEIFSRQGKLPDEVKDNKELGWYIAQKYPFLRARLDAEQRDIVKQVATRAILRRALKTLGPTKRSAKLKREPYRLGADEIDLEATLEHIMGNKDYRLEDIIVERRENKKLTVALMLDTSLSMAGEKLAVAAVGASILALQLKDDDYSLVTFESQARVLKPMQQRRDVEAVIGDLLDAPATGDTNMEAGLRTGLEELGKVRTGERLGIIITDGQCTSGFHPELIAVKFPKLCVIMIESPITNAETCTVLASLGKGRVYRVKDYYQVPRVIYDLLREFG